jgi:hypothetical protein
MIHIGGARLWQPRTKTASEGVDANGLGRVQDAVVVSSACGVATD